MKITPSQKNLKEFGDKLPEDKKSSIQEASDALKKAKEENNLEGIDSALENLNKCWQAASNEMQQAQAAASSNGQDTQSSSESGTATDVTDVDFEEVKDDK